MIPRSPRLVVQAVRRAAFSCVELPPGSSKFVSRRLFCDQPIALSNAPTNRITLCGHVISHPRERLLSIVTRNDSPSIHFKLCVANSGDDISTVQAMMPVQSGTKTRLRVGDFVQLQGELRPVHAMFDAVDGEERSETMVDVSESP